MEQVVRPACYLVTRGRRNRSEAFMSYKFLLVTVILLALADPTFANWWIVRAADEKCLVVDIEPSGKDITKVGKDVYESREQAEADVKKVCKENPPPRTPN
jgi:hypothetical protein